MILCQNPFLLLRHKPGDALSLPTEAAHKARQELQLRSELDIVAGDQGPILHTITSLSPLSPHSV